MVKINLLPHREQRRKERTVAFYALLVAFIVAGCVVVFFVAAYFSTRISSQQALNATLTQENRKLDVQITEIASLKDEIASLKARQQAVEDLQGDRNQSVYLMAELVKQVPEGIYLTAFNQNGQRVELKGYAQSNERVSQLLRNISSNSPWLEKPDLIEITATTIGTGRDSKRVFQFTMNIGIKRPSSVNEQGKATAAMDAANPAAPAGTATATATPSVGGIGLPPMSPAPTAQIAPTAPIAPSLPSPAPPAAAAPVAQLPAPTVKVQPQIRSAAPATPTIRP